MRVFCSVWLLLVSGFLATAQEKLNPFEPEILAFEASDRTNPPPQHGILFIGSSSIRMWKSLAADFPEHPVINRGFGGSQIVDSIHYANRIIFKYHPKQIILYAGGNDIHAGKSAKQVFSDFKDFVRTVRKGLPDTEIDYISIAPNRSRWAEVERVKGANRLIEAYMGKESRLRFINVFPAMLGSDGEPKPDIYLDDKLHMNAKGYELWKGIVRPYLH
ncbi:MAG TPA: SGNH/GDSL hydrolase family protein [Candidatus Saccharimonadales bacterium]|nr:SGNH/GDSL hydrolase family protein [Candidatus Saccharimonadales bacterium]